MRISMAAGSVIALTGLAVMGTGRAAEPESPWLWPPPQRIEALDGGMALKGVSVLIPDAAGRRVTAVAGALAKYTAFYHKNDMPIVRVKDLPAAPYAIVVAKTADAAVCRKLLDSVSLDAVPAELPDRRIWRRESYVLRVTPDGAVIAAPEAAGLLQGARTFMQMAKVAVKTGRDSLPAVNIADWPEMPEHHFCVVGPGRYVSENNADRVSAMLGELKYNHVMFALYGYCMTYRLHPEIRTGSAPDAMLGFANRVRSLGLPTWPWLVDYCGGPHKGGGYIVYEPDSEEYYQVRFEMMDEILETFRPDAFNLCMSEQYMAGERWNGWRRTKQDWYAAIQRQSDYCLRRGVTPSIWGDCFSIGGNFEPWERILDTDAEGVRRMPRELIVAPWNYANIGRYEYPWEKLAGKEFGLRAMNGCATWGTDGTFHAQHMVKYGKDSPLLWGLTAVVWGGGDGEVGTKAVYECAGSLWNCRLGVVPKQFSDEAVLLTEPLPEEGEEPPIVETPQAAPNAEKEAERLSELIARLGSQDAGEQEDASRDLIATGTAGAPAILAAMGRSTPAEGTEAAGQPLRGRLRRVLERICRAGRKKEIPRKLEIAAVEKFLADPAADVRDMAVELMASCAPKERAVPVLLEGFNNKNIRAACARAAGAAGIREAAGHLVAMVSDEEETPENRLTAARALGQIRPASAGAQVAAVLAKAKDPALKEALESALALIRTEQIVAENKRIMKTAPYAVRSPDFLEPLGLEAMLWREPDGPVAEYVAKLADQDFLVWEEAREELVGFGAGKAADILDAMAQSPAIEPGKTYGGVDRPLRWKLEGVLSRICRDARHGEAVGKLDVAAVEKHLAAPCPYVRDIAAELITSCAPREEAAALLLKGLERPECFSACARAAGIGGVQEAAGALVRTAADEKAPPDHRTAAALALGYLRPEKAGQPLLAALRGAKEAGLKKELIRTLSLIGMKEADEEIARHLDPAEDKFVRLRAAVALVNMKSEKAARTEAWLTEKDRAVVEVGCWALGKRFPKEEALQKIERAVELQDDPTLKRALRYQLSRKMFLQW